MKDSTTKLYNGKNCSCPASCVRKGNCKACIAFHHDRDEKTYCEKINDEDEKSPAWSHFKKALLWLKQALCPA